MFNTRIEECVHIGKSLQIRPPDHPPTRLGDAVACKIMLSLAFGQLGREVPFRSTRGYVDDDSIAVVMRLLSTFQIGNSDIFWPDTNKVKQLYCWLSYRSNKPTTVHKVLPMPTGRTCQLCNTRSLYCSMPRRITNLPNPILTDPRSRAAFANAHKIDERGYCLISALIWYARDPEVFGLYAERDQTVWPLIDRLHDYRDQALGQNWDRYWNESIWPEEPEQREFHPGLTFGHEEE
jgi:hypothetical protein